MRLIDAGYFSWVYGTRPQFGGWDTLRMSFKADLFCMDSPQSWRAEVVTRNYKGRRAERRELDPAAMARKEQVEVFRTILREDPLVRSIELEGYEADDLVAVAFLNSLYQNNPVDSIIAMDKDLVQVPGLWPKMQRTDGSYVFDSITGLPKRVPMYWGRSKTPRDVLLGQLLFGDKSDSIPRLVYKKDSSLVAALKRSEQPFTDLYEALGIPVLTSLWLLVIPAAPLHDQWPVYERNYRKFLRDLDNGSYWMGPWLPNQDLLLTTM